MAPGITEDREGKPFIGSAGYLLRQLLEELKFPKDIAWANAVCCYPGRKGGGDAKPTIPQLNACKSHLIGQIEVIKPSFIFLVGGTALEAFRPDLSLSNVHGQPLFYDAAEMQHTVSWTQALYVWTIYHPAAALRNRKYERLIREDLENFWTWRRNGMPWPDRCAICQKDVFKYDGWGFPMCELHAMRQGQLPLTEKAPRAGGLLPVGRGELQAGTSA